MAGATVSADMGTKGKTKGLIRAHSRAGTSSGKTHRAERSGRPPEPAICERCGAVFRRRAWHAGRTASHALLARAHWVTCPACVQRRDATYLGRLRIVGPSAVLQEDLIRRRSENVAARAEAAQPEHRIVSIERDGDALEILTTSQKLAHRLAHELKEVLGGKVTYRWSDDGSLFATWAPGRAARTTRTRAGVRTKRR